MRWREAAQPVYKHDGLRRRTPSRAHHCGQVRATCPHQAKVIFAALGHLWSLIASSQSVLTFMSSSKSTA